MRNFFHSNMLAIFIEQFQEMHVNEIMIMRNYHQAKVSAKLIKQYSAVITSGEKNHG
jgi:hypothetical protein